MRKEIFLALVIHNHQPVGNFDYVFERACREAYEPMIALIEKHPGIRITLHYSGCLLDWIIKNRGDLIERLKALVARNQIEIMTGGYYEPVLIAIPDSDKKGQINKLSSTVSKLFGYEPQGAWLTERVWEPHIAKSFADCDVEYTIVDDTHFKYAGLNEDALYGYYVTEEQGKKLNVFSTLKSLRYSIPWENVDTVIDWLKSKADSSGSKLALMGDDGEKFGMWPGTYEHCWGKKQDGNYTGSDNPGSIGWMEKYFSALEENSDIIKTITPAEYKNQFPPIGRVYLPTASYDEMTEWVLPVKLAAKFKLIKNKLAKSRDLDTLRFLKGGFWRNFMVKYPEINTMHKKMLRVSGKIHKFLNEYSGETSIKLLDNLWAGQCNCPYWHGVFGGVYLFHIRSAVYENLLKAELLLDRLKKKVRKGQENQKGSQALNNAVCEKTDFDLDGRYEILIETEKQNFYIAPSNGGACFEWDWRERYFNILNTLTRREEVYHRDLIMGVKEGRAILSDSEKPENIHTEAVRIKEKGLEKRLFYDRNRRLSFVDRFIHEKSGFKDFYKSQFIELGNFVSEPYEYSIVSEKATENITENGVCAVKLYRQGEVKSGKSTTPLLLEKTFKIKKEDEVTKVDYKLTNTGGSEISTIFGVETNWALMGGNSEGSYFTAEAGLANVKKRLDSMGEIKKTLSVVLHLDWLNMDINVSWINKAKLWWYPVETISNSEGGFERIYQGLCVMPMWPVLLKPGESFCEQLTVILR